MNTVAMYSNIIKKNKKKTDITCGITVCVLIQVFRSVKKTSLTSNSNVSTAASKRGAFQVGVHENATRLPVFTPGWCYEEATSEAKDPLE